MTTDNRKIQLETEVVDSTKAGFDSVKNNAAAMAKGVEQSADRASKAVDGIGAGADKSAAQASRAYGRFESEIRRVTAAMQAQAEGTGKAGEILNRALAQGLDTSRLEGSLQKLRAVEAQSLQAQRAATGSLNSMGMSAKATAAALRGVPAQFTDIVTSLQGGQAPLTVFLQQGGQLKDMFGGAGNAARALGGYVLGLVNPFTVAAAAAVALAVAYNQGSKEADSYAKSIALTGNAAGTTGVQLQQMATRISTSVGTQGAAADALAQLVGTGKVAAQNLEQFAETAVRVERTLGVSIKDTVKEFAELGKAPVEASKKLNESYGYLTAAVFEQIKALESQGRALDAAALAQQSYDRAMTAATSTLEGRLGYIERAWRGVGDAAKIAWDKMLNIGRPDTLATQLESARANLEQKMNTPLAVDNPAMRASRDKGIESLRSEIALLSEQERVLKRGAEAQALRTQAEKDGIAAAEALQKTQDKGLSKQQQMNKALAEYRKQLADLKATNPGSERLAPDAVARGESSIREQFADKGAIAAVNKQESAYASLAAAINEKIKANEQELLTSAPLNEADKIRIKLTEQLATGAKDLTATRVADLNARLQILDVQEREKTALVDSLKTSQARQALREKETDGIAAWIAAQEAAASSSLASVRDRVSSLVDEQQALSLSVTANISLAEAVERVAQARLLEKQQQFVEGSEGYLNIQREIDARKELLGLISSNEANKTFISNWKDSVSQYEDVFRRGFADMLNNGRDGWKSFTRSLVTTFKTAVADQIYKMFAQKFVVNIVGNLMGVVGGGVASTAAAAAGGSSAASGASTALSAASLFGAGGLGGSLAAGAGWLTGATTLGGSLTAGASLIGTGTLAGLTSGLGVLAGALGPIALGVGALMAIAKATKGETRTGGQFGVAFDGSVTNNRRGETYTYQGQQFDRDFSNGQRNALTNGQAYRLEGDPVAQEAAIRDAVSGTASGINAFLKALGSSATVAGFSAGLETSGKGRGGVFAGGTLSTGAAFGESGKGDNYAGTLYEKFSTNSPDFKTALENFTLDLKQSTIQALQTVSDIPDAVKKTLEGIDAEALTDDAANKLLEAINTQIVGVNQFKDALKAMGLDTLAELSFDAAAGLAEVSGGFDKLIGNLSTYYTNFFSPEEQRANVQRQLDDQFKTLGLTLPDINSEDARAQYRAIVEAASKDMSEEGRKTYAVLLSLAGAFAGITTAAEDTEKALKKKQEDQRNAAYSALERAIGAERKALESQLSIARDVADTVGNIFDILHDNVRELYGEVDSTRAMQASQGNAFIEQALAIAKKSGYLPDADKLAEAISAARGGLDAGGYVSQFAADRDRLVLAGKLSGLEKITEKQLTDAQRTVRALETQIDQGEQVLDYWQQQIDIASGTYEGILSVEAAVQQLSNSLSMSGETKPGKTSGGGGAGFTAGGGYSPRVDYSAQEALGSFEKFKAWYNGLRGNSNTEALKDGGYKVPDWLRVGGMADDGTDQELFGTYTFYKNNPQYAQDYEQIMTTGRSSFGTDGKSLIKSDLSKMPTEIADYFKGDTASLLSYEGLGLDPVLAYKLYRYGPEQFGLDPKNTNFTQYLRSNKWTPDGIVQNDNVGEYAAAGYSGYNLARRDLATGNIVDLDGRIYSNDGKPLGTASRALMESVYGSAFIGTSGNSYGEQTRSGLYNQHIKDGYTPEQYYSSLRSSTDQLISSGIGAQALADAMFSTGTSLQDMANAYGVSPQEIAQNLMNAGATNIPKFDIGTNYVPRDMLAYIHEGEAVVPKAYNPAASGVGGGNAELVAEVRALREAMAALQAAASETAGNTRPLPQLGRQFDQYSNGGQFSRQKAVA